MTKIVSYDKENDILSIHKGFDKDEKFKGNIDVGELILDVSTRGRVKGIEILNATEFFKDFEIGRTILSHMKDANFTASLNPNRIMLGILIKTERKEIPAKIAVPLEIPDY